MVAADGAVGDRYVAPAAGAKATAEDLLTIGKCQSVDGHRPVAGDSKDPVECVAINGQLISAGAVDGYVVVNRRQGATRHRDCPEDASRIDRNWQARRERIR